MGNIDVHSASERGIYVAACKGRNAAAVAELTMGILLSLDRRIPDAVQSIRAGKWEKGAYSSAAGLKSKKIGILGLGAVGQEVLERARAFGMIPYAWSRGLTASRAREMDVTAAKSPKDLASKVDILTVHLAANERTAGLVSRDVINALPQGATFINVARSELVDQTALLELAEKKQLRVGLDVYADFPHVPTASFDPPKFPPHVLWYGTPHIGSQTQEAKRAIAAETARIVRGFLVEGMVPNAVNVRTAHSARYQIVIRHYDKVGALANALNVLKRHKINVEELKTNVFEQGTAACTRINVVARPTEHCLQEIGAFHDEVLHVQLVALPILA
ncbi:MAG: D-3-phosphoglycerate dehydrogenase [Sorangium cellulosum]|nr:MAG: D-3-phosphoglycerate dehydrogenase [Sorangium cellulosum]